LVFAERCREGMHMIFFPDESGFVKLSKDRRYEIRSQFSKNGAWHFVNFEGRRIGEYSSMKRAEQACDEHAK
jgi:hypothetical protein